MRGLMQIKHERKWLSYLVYDGVVVRPFTPYPIHVHPGGEGGGAAVLRPTPHYLQAATIRHHGSCHARMKLLSSTEKSLSRIQLHTPDFYTGHHPTKVFLPTPA
ncbi:hypothetical protein BaRGS_00030948 [Batillaria attramentaria]|uniref:Uncharacterized protein n=1 Tax=Batillaria attramentaria TaxID=370345 RepID=A0ABD0JSV5_9CAEN